MAGRDLVVIGGSAGALEALTALVSRIPLRMASTLLIAVHRGTEAPGRMPEVLSRCGTLHAEYAANDEVFEAGRIYIAPPDHHLLVSGNALRVTRGPREHGFRPAIDPLFRTAAREHGPRTVGVILSGALDDGVEGLALVKRHGGVAIVQRPDDAVHDDMPTHALEQVPVDHVLPAGAIGPLLERLSHEQITSALPSPPPRDVAENGDAALRMKGPPGVLQPFACPECGGTLWQSHPGGQSYFRCHVGHTFTTRTLVALQEGRLERALWTALRNLEEHAALRRRLASRARGGALDAMAATYEHQARRSEEHANVLRTLLVEPDGESVPVTTSSDT